MKTIDEYGFIEDSNDGFDFDEQYAIVCKPDGKTYRIKASALATSNRANIEYLPNSIIVSTATSGNVGFSTSNVFSRSMSAVLVSVFHQDSANPNFILNFYTNSSGVDESKHVLKLNHSSKAQWSGHYIWLPVIQDRVYADISTTSAAKVEIAICAAM